MTERHKFQRPRKDSLLSQRAAAIRPGPPGTTRYPGQKSPVFHYETDRYQLVTPGWPEVSEDNQQENGITLA